jgi:hypothetical protein
MKLIDEPSHSGYAIPARTYRVTYWQKQLPPPGSPYAAEEMGWSALHFDFAEAQDVHEVVDWAETHFEEHTRTDSERGYVIGLWTPDGLLSEPTLIQLVGHDPTVVDSTYNLRRRPLSPRPRA